MVHWANRNEWAIVDQRTIREPQMPTSHQNIVWILGAGFNRSLGGPLLKDLLRYYTETGVKRLHADLLASGLKPEEKDRRESLIGDMARVRQLFHDESKQGLWEDAEQFLDYVETAAEEDEAEFNQEPSYAHLVLEDIAHRHGFDALPALAFAARRAIVADCLMFLWGAQPNSEKWMPYREWSQHLGVNHSVVTFNYDMLPDLLAANAGRLLVSFPGGQDDKEKAKAENKARVFKVHGSVDWGHDRERIFKATIPEASLLWKTLDDFAIGVPGPQKSRLINGPLSAIWKEALACIRQANIVVFVGYRFPPSDAQSRQGILGAIRENKGPLRVLTVLGPTSQDSPRLNALLGAALKPDEGFELTTLPLFAEDFLSLAWEMGLF